MCKKKKKKKNFEKVLESSCLWGQLPMGKFLFGFFWFFLVFFWFFWFFWVFGFFFSLKHDLMDVFFTFYSRSLISYVLSFSIVTFHSFHFFNSHLLSHLVLCLTSNFQILFSHVVSHLIFTSLFRIFILFHLLFHILCQLSFHIWFLHLDSHLAFTCCFASYFHIFHILFSHLSLLLLVQASLTLSATISAEQPGRPRCRGRARAASMPRPNKPGTLCW
jgi:hypothetical protein